MSFLKNTFKEGSKYQLFFISIIATGLAYGIYKGVIDNYLAEIVVMGEFDRGVAEFFRELPGLLLVFILAVFYTLSAETLYKVGSIIMLIGMGMLSIISPTKVLVTVAICIHSLGEHIQLGMKSSIALTNAKENSGGVALGYMNSANQIGTLAGYLVIIVALSLIAGKTPFKVFFGIAAGITAVAMFTSFGITGKSETDKSKSRFYFRKKFMTYYILEVFYGARKQVFFTFGPYVLILFYGADASVISILFAVSAISGFILSPFIGKLIDKVGYKIVMVMDTVILVVVCIFYGFAHHWFPMNVAFIVCCINYVADSIISLASMASNVYVKELSDSQEEMKATISTGISVNHMITILIALFGGWIWSKLGMETLFILSAVLGLCNSAYAMTIKTGKKAEKIRN